MIWYGAGWRSTWGKCAPLLEAAGVHVPWLFSYAYLSGARLCEALAWPFPRFLDSGAFTAATRGAPVDLDRYIDFCHTHRGDFNPYAALDVLGNETLTHANLVRMRSAGLDPLPTWHITSSHAALRAIVSEGRYFAIGGMVGMRTKLRRHLLRAAWDTIVGMDSSPRVHGFGLTRVSDLLAFPWYSVDSSSLMTSSALGKKHTVVNGVFLGVVDGSRGQAAADRRLIHSVLSWLSVMRSVSEHWDRHTYVPRHGAVRTTLES